MCVLGISYTGGSKPLVMTAVLSKNQPTIITVAQVISELLGIPLVMVGNPVEGSQAMRQAVAASLHQGAVQRGPPDIRINCPRCGAKNTLASAYDHVEKYKELIPWTTTWVKCLACDATLYSKMRAKDLPGRTPEELEGTVIFRQPGDMVRRTLLILAIVLVWAPIAGLVVALPAVVLNWRKSKGTRYTALIVCILSLAWTGGISLLVYNDGQEAPVRHSIDGGYNGAATTRLARGAAK